MKWISILGMVLTTACGISGPDTVRLHVWGTVREPDGSAVAGAVVELYPPSLFVGSSANIASTSTDQVGHYAISGSADSPCTGNGFGYVVTATTGTRQSDAASVQCLGTDQNINLTLRAPTP